MIRSPTDSRRAISGKRRQPRLRALESRYEQRIGMTPSARDFAPVRHGAVPCARPAQSVPRLRKQLVQLGARDVQVRRLERAAERRLQNGDRIARAVLSQVEFSELEV